MANVRTFVSIGAVINYGQGTMTAVAGVVDPLHKMQNLSVRELFTYAKRENSNDFTASRHSGFQHIETYRTCNYVMSKEFTPLTCTNADVIMQQLFGATKDEVKEKNKGAQVSRYQSYITNLRCVNI